MSLQMDGKPLLGLLGKILLFFHFCSYFADMPLVWTILSCMTQLSTIETFDQGTLPARSTSIASDVC